jgi:hypothetical protein
MRRSIRSLPKLRCPVNNGHSCLRPPAGIWMFLQTLQALGSQGVNVAAGGCKKSRCIPESPPWHERASHTAGDVSARFSGCPRSFPSARYRSNCLSGTWKPACQTGPAACDSHTHNIGFLYQNDGSVPLVAVCCEPHARAPWPLIPASCARPWRSRRFHK